MSPAFGGKPKELNATVIIQLPPIDADSQRFQTYDFDEMKKKYEEELRTEFNDHLEGDYDKLVIKIELKDG